MCLAIPAKIVSVDSKNNTATVDYGGVLRETRLDMVEAEVGEWVLIHAGFAIEVLQEDVALKNLEAINSLADLQTEIDNQEQDLFLR